MDQYSHILPLIQLVCFAKLFSSGVIQEVERGGVLRTPVGSTHIQIRPRVYPNVYISTRRNEDKGLNV